MSAYYTQLDHSAFLSQDTDMRTILRRERNLPFPWAELFLLDRWGCRILAYFPPNVRNRCSFLEFLAPMGMTKMSSRGSRSFGLIRDVTNHFSLLVDSFSSVNIPRYCNTIVAWILSFDRDCLRCWVLKNPCLMQVLELKVIFSSFKSGELRFESR